jgi:class 3 adenylate cyclase
MALDRLRPWLAHGELDRLTLRFRDDQQERAYRADFAEHNLGAVRLAHVLGIGLWIFWGIAVRGYLAEDRGFDLAIRYALLIPLTATGLGLTFLPSYPRWWRIEADTLLVITVVVWVTYATSIESMPIDFGYVGVILIVVFAFSLIRVPLLDVCAISAIAMITYLLTVVITRDLPGVRLGIAAFYLASFVMFAIITSYALERSSRLLFLRERQLDRERERSDSLLLNILPRTLVDRLKARHEEAGHARLAEALDEVTVLFADAVAFTEQTEKTSPDELVAALDELFTRFDTLADRFGLEKIKTIGDAYMAVAGAPEPRADHAEAAAEMALEMLAQLADARWPSGDPIALRIGMASGPVVAGVIGQRKFAYDLWGDTVNLASRLETHGQRGRIMVSERLATVLERRFAFGPPLIVELKGKGPTSVRFLTGRRSVTEDAAEEAVTIVDRVD